MSDPKTPVKQEIVSLSLSDHDSSRSSETLWQLTMRVCLPSYQAAEDVNSVNPAQRLLVALRGASDKAGNSALAVFADTVKQLGAQEQEIKRTLKAAFNDPDLAGSGAQKLCDDLLVQLNYCCNPKMDFRLPVCQILLPEGHEGVCPKCKQATQREGCKGKSSFQNLDLVLRLGKCYIMMLKSTDLGQQIADYYEESLKDLSASPSDLNARVRSVESALLARRMYAQTPRKFTFDIEAKAGEDAMLRSTSGEICLVHVVSESNAGYHVRKKDGVELDVPDKSRVEKIGGNIPINVITFHDAAEVFQTMALQFSNSAFVEEIQNIFRSQRRRAEFLTLLGVTTG